MLTHYRLLFVFLFIGFANSLSAQWKETIVYDRGSIDISPKYILPAHDQGLIIAGAIDYREEFIMKVDSLNNPIWARSIKDSNAESYYYSESAMSFTDSTYMMIAPYRPADSTYNFLSIAEITEDGTSKAQRLIDFGESVTPVKQISIEGDESLVMTNGPSNFVVNLDSLGYPQWTLSYQDTQNSLNFSSIKKQSDSTFFAFGESGGDLIIASIKNSGEIMWTKSLSLEIDFDAFFNDIDVLVQDSLIHMLICFYQDVYFVTLDEAGNYKSGNRYNFMPNAAKGGNKTGFMTSDSTGYLLYAGNSILKINLQGQIINSIGDVINFRGFYKTDSTFYMLVNDGFIPALSPVGNVNDMGMFTGGKLSEIFDIYTPCVSYGYGGGGGEIQVESDTFIMIQSNVDFLIIDSVSLIDEFVIEKDFGCPSFASSVTELSASDINIFPNPTNSFFTINSEEIIQEITVYNAFGELVSQSRGIENSEVQFDSSSWIPGMYYVQIKIDNQIVSKCVVVNR